VHPRHYAPRTVAVVADPRRALRDARLYLCTDSRARQGDLEQFLDAVLRAGVDIVQLREKGLEARHELRLLETAALALARKIVVTSPLTARTLIADFAVSAHKITVAEPGTDPAPRATFSGQGPAQLLSVGAIVPRKACDLLVRALSPLRDRDWQLTIAGPTDRSLEALAHVNAAIRATGLGHRIRLAGPVDGKRLAGLYASADAVVTASLYEGYGMALAEAMNRRRVMWFLLMCSSS